MTPPPIKLTGTATCTPGPPEPPDTGPAPASAQAGAQAGAQAAPGPAPGQQGAVPTSVIEGDLIVKGVLRITGGAIRFGGDDNPETTDDLALFLQPNCGSIDAAENPVQSALCLEPIRATNGALLLLIPGDQVKAGTIAGQVNIYGPLWPGNPRRQRLTLTVYVQSDGNPFGTLDTTMSGTGDPQGKREMPVLFANGNTNAARLDQKGFTIQEPPPGS